MALACPSLSFFRPAFLSLQHDHEYDRLRGHVAHPDRRHTSNAADMITMSWTAIHWRTLVERHDDETVFTRGPVGENVLHVCALIRSGKPDGHAIIRYLCDTFGPRLINAPYQFRRSRDAAPGLFDGETVLHVAIVNKVRSPSCPLGFLRLCSI